MERRAACVSICVIRTLPRLKFTHTGSNLAAMALQFFLSDPGFRSQHAIEDQPAKKNRRSKVSDGKCGER